MRDDWVKFEGQVFHNKFPLQKFLGSTSYGAVFLSQSPPPQAKKIAIKFIAAGAKADFQASLLQRAAKLSHPNLLRLLPGGRSQLGDRDLVFAFLEYAEEDLGRSLPDRPLSEKEAREMLGALLEALSHIHSKGFAHSHVKPSNIMAIGNQLKLSSDTVLPLGEPRPAYRPLDAYDAPEAATAPVADSSDVWSLGVTLVEVLTQQAPVSSPESQGDPVVPSSIPQPFLEIARNCLRRDSLQRWTTAQIADFLNSAPIQVAAPEVQVAAREVTVSAEKEKEAAKENPTSVQIAAPAVTVNAEKKTEPPKEMWVDSNYCWVVVCKNHWFHRRRNFFNVHRIPLGETDAVLPRPEMDEPLTVRCDECGQEYLYKPFQVLRYEMEAPVSFVPHPLFRGSLQDDKTHKYESTSPPLAIPKKPLIGTFERAVGTVFVVLIVAGFALSNLPKLSVDVSDSRRPDDLMGTTFHVNNKGILPVYDVRVGCEVKRVDISPPVDSHLVVPTTIYFPESYAEMLSAGEEMTVPCGRAIPVKPDNTANSEIHAEMFLVVSYRPKGVWWHKSEKFPMETQKTENGTWVWKSIPR